MKWLTLYRSNWFEFFFFLNWPQCRWGFEDSSGSLCWRQECHHDSDLDVRLSFVNVADVRNVTETVISRIGRCCFPLRSNKIYLVLRKMCVSVILLNQPKKIWRDFARQEENKKVFSFWLRKKWSFYLFLHILGKFSSFPCPGKNYLSRKCCSMLYRHSQSPYQTGQKFAKK